MVELGHSFTTLGCPAYPQGHPDIPDAALGQALRDKAPYVAHVTTQMDFDTDAIARWIRARRAEGFAPEIVIGVPGVADPQKLLSIAARIGVTDAKRFLVKNLRFVTGLARSGGFYKPTGFVEALAPLIADPAAGVGGLHLYTFNAVAATEAWRGSMRAKLDVCGGGPRDPARLPIRAAFGTMRGQPKSTGPVATDPAAVRVP
jgi:methylenetetrahydrofolate reductase (NADPH)